MPIEIERRFLMNGKPVPIGAIEPINIEQGYLSRDPVVRIRKERTMATDRAVITIKGRGLVARPEYEYEIPYDDAIDLMPLAYASLLKLRYHVKVGAHVWDVDKFISPKLDGLWIAEVELKSPDEAFERPEWIAEEITEDVRYANVRLAEHGKP